jgi:Mn-dependent DtxR family transcriptional regulator
VKPRAPTEREILAALRDHGDNVPGNLADLTGRHPKSVSRSLSRLEEDGYVRNKGRGVYTLTDEGREAADQVRS